MLLLQRFILWVGVGILSLETVPLMAQVKPGSSNPCRDILTSGIFDEEKYLSNSSYKEIVEDLVYSLEIRTTKQAQAAGLDVSLVYDGIPIDFGGTYSSEGVDNWRKEYLNKHKQVKATSSAQEAYRKAANPNVVAAWSKCIDKFLKEPEGLTVELKRISSRRVSLSVAYNPRNNAECHLTMLDLSGIKHGVGPKNLVPGVKLGKIPLVEVFDVLEDEIDVLVSTDVAGGAVRSLNMQQTHLNQLLALTKYLPQAGWVVGEIRVLPAGTIPNHLRLAGWRECNGDSLPTADYRGLFNVIGQSWGTETPVGPGATPPTFRIPDLRGQFLRGWDHGANIDPDRGQRTAKFPNGATGDSVGSFQPDSVGGHKHPMGDESTFYHLAAHEGPKQYMPVTSDGNTSNSWTWRSTSTRENSGSQTAPRNASVMFIIYTGVKP